jgi:hypothetical protein
VQAGAASPLSALRFSLQAGRLRRARRQWLLPIGTVELPQIAGDALIDLRHAPLHLRPCEVLVTVIHRLAFARNSLSYCRHGDNVCPRARLEPLCVKILVEIAALWALSFLNLALALPREFARPTDRDDDAAEQPKIQPAV